MDWIQTLSIIIMPILLAIVGYVLKEVSVLRERINIGSDIVATKLDSQAVEKLVDLKLQILDYKQIELKEDLLRIEDKIDKLNISICSIGNKF
jgi:predicted Holliday junction resolvase-like endonuclease